MFSYSNIIEVAEPELIQKKKPSIIEIAAMRFAFASLMRDYDNDMEIVLAKAMIDTNITYDTYDILSVCDDELTVLDGCYNLYILGKYVINSFFISTNENIVMRAYKYNPDIDIKDYDKSNEYLFYLG